MAEKERELEKYPDSEHIKAHANCELCLKFYSRFHRAGFGCGYIPEHEWDCKSAGGPLGSALLGEPVSVCAGYTTSLDEVRETNRALSWRKDGALSDYLDGEKPTPLLKDAMDVLDSSTLETRGEVSRKTREDSKRG